MTSPTDGDELSVSTDNPADLYIKGSDLTKDVTVTRTGGSLTYGENEAVDTLTLTADEVNAGVTIKVNSYMLTTLNGETSKAEATSGTSFNVVISSDEIKTTTVKVNVA